MKINFFFLFINILFSDYFCTTSQFPIMYNDTFNRQLSRAERCLNNDIGSILTFKIDDDFNSSTQSISKNFLLIKKDIETQSCLFVDSDLSFAESLLDSIWTTFLYSTPNQNFPNGIKAEEELLFGLPPSIDGISEVNILLYDFNNESIRGYFSGNDQIDCENNNCSNIVYLNADNYMEDNIQRSLFTLAHEYQHLLHWNSDPYEGNYLSENGDWYLTSPWVNEGLSDLAPSILGLGQRDFSPFLNDSYLTLDYWPIPGSDVNLSSYYAKSALFFQYIFENYNSYEFPLINMIFSSQNQGLDSIIDILNLTDIDFNDLYVNWIIKNITGSYSSINNEISQESNVQIVNNDKYLSYQDFINNFKKYSYFIYKFPKNHKLFDEIQVELDNNSYRIIDSNFGDLGSNLDFVNDHIIYRNTNLVIFSNNRILDTNLNLNVSFKEGVDKLVIYPNPTFDNNLNFVFVDSFIKDYIDINIFNINGNLVERINIDKNDYLNRNLNSFKIDYNKYSSGVYIVNIGDNSKLISIIK